MAKQTGLGDQLFIGGVNIGADISTIGGLSTPRTTLDATGITQYANARLYGTRDGQAEFTAYFNDATGETHEALKTLPRTDTHLMYLRGLGAGRPGLGMPGKQIGYDPTRGDDGALTLGVAVSANGYGADWGVQLTDGITTHVSADSNDPGVDLGTGTKAFGFQAYLQVFSIGSGTATVTIHSSSDDGGGDAYAAITNGSFASVTAPGAQRIQSTSDTLSVERYLKVVTTGVFTDLVFAVIVNRNDALRAI